MARILQKVSHFIYKKFKILWLLITIVLFAIILLINRDVNLQHSQKITETIALKLSNNVDELIEDIFQDVYTLPLYGKEFKDCKTDIFPEIQRITINNPKISGLIITDLDHHFECANLAEIKPLISQTTRARTLNGPFKLSLFDQPVYLIQQKMGKYFIGIVIVSSVLEAALQTPNEITNSIAIFNTVRQQNTIKIERRNDSRWVSSVTLPPMMEESEYATAKLQSVNSLQLVVYQNPNTVWYYLWTSQALVGSIFLIIAGVFYILLRDLFTQRYSLNGLIKIALKNNEFFPVYQPVFDTKTGRFSGVEILLRWQQSHKTIIMPDLFIEEAENSGLIIPITLQIIDIAFHECKKLLLDKPYFHLAFNVTALHFTDGHFFSKFEDLIKAYNISPHQIIFEITERELLDQNNQIFKLTMDQLINQGYSIAIDDYGTGHASISYLRSYPFNYLKIDKLFVSAIGTQAITESLIDAIIRMAKLLNLAIIAEGVESKEQVDYLINNGVQYLQGWFYSRALSYSQLIEALQRTDHDT